MCQSRKSAKYFKNNKYLAFDLFFRIISPEKLAFVFGLQYMSTNIFAHIPGPVIFGHLVDIDCIIW